MSYDPGNNPTDLARHQERNPHELDADPGRHGPDEQLTPMNLPPSVRHFIELARGGSLPTASSGERGARRIAGVLIGYLPYLDRMTMNGAIQFAELVRHFPNGVRELLAKPPENHP